MTDQTGEWPLDLLEWKRRVVEMYRLARAGAGSANALAAFRTSKDSIFRAHPQSPITPDRRAAFTGLDYFDHRPDLRVTCAIEPTPDDDDAGIALPVLSGEPVRAKRIGHVRPNVEGTSIILAVYWLEGYAGGLFLPFRDATAGSETYGGGRYLLDTVKGADLGASTDGAQIVVDFNYAYNPSCAYDPGWVCPLAPIENRVSVAIRAGERQTARSGW